MRDRDAFAGPPLARTIDDAGTRAYLSPTTGRDLVSVTTAGGGVVGKDKHEALMGWATRETALAAWDNRFALIKIDDRDAASDLLKNARYRSGGRAMLRGSTVHRILEAIEREEEVPEVSEGEAGYVDAFLGFVEAFRPEFVEVEATVFNEEHGYAGTFDFLARIDGHLVLGDHKTGKDVYPEVALQLAALRYAETIWNRETGELAPMPKVDGTIVVHLRPDGFRVVEVNADEVAFDAFLHCVGLYPWLKRNGLQSRAVGPSMTPTRLRRSLEEASV
jgi:hypothetical protein